MTLKTRSHILEEAREIKRQVDIQLMHWESKLKPRKPRECSFLIALTLMKRPKKSAVEIIRNF